MGETDTISRQAAIDAIDVLCQEHRYKIPGKRETYSRYNEAWQDALDRAEGAIFNLPSVQPDHIADIGRKVERTAETAQNVQNEDLILRKAAIESIRECAEVAHDNREWGMEQGYLNAIECVEEEPPAQPEIIRCKDCDYWNERQGRMYCGEMYFDQDDPNFYCGYARRRTDG